MKKIIEVKVEDFKCEYCGHEEYSVFNPYSSKRQIYCNKCGKIDDIFKDFSIEIPTNIIEQPIMLSN